jgi:hypothetical protein
MKRIIVFRYHDQLDVCKSRLMLLKQFNPNTPIYGLYGGPEDQYSDYESGLSELLSANYCFKGKDAKWKWKNGDLVILEWFKDFGKDIDFRSLVLSEWDLVFFKPIETLYQHIPFESIGLTGLVPLSSVEKKWFWTADPVHGEDWEKLLEHAVNEHNYSSKPFACILPGAHISKTFLQFFSNTEVKDLCHDELRIPLYAQILGFDIRDTGFYHSWFSRSELNFFNANEVEITSETINKQLQKKNGRRVFHPYRGDLNNINVISEFEDSL